MGHRYAISTYVICTYSPSLIVICLYIFLLMSFEDLIFYFNDTQIIIFSKGIITKKSTLSGWQSCFLYFMSRIKKKYGALFFKVMPQQRNWQSLLAYGYISTVKIDSMRLGIIL